MRLATINVDGTSGSGSGRSATEYIDGVLRVSSDMILMQEVVPEMYGVLHPHLIQLNWKVYR